MNSTYDSSPLPKVFIDTTVLCGALRTDGVNRKILKAARFPNLYVPVVSKVCLFEFVRNAANGLGKGNGRVVYDHLKLEESSVFTLLTFAPAI